MPDTDLSPAVPPDAKWVKIRYELRPKVPGSELSARLWSGPLDDAVTIRGTQGEVFLKLRVPQRLSDSKSEDVHLKLKVVAYSCHGISQK